MQDGPLQLFHIIRITGGDAQHMDVGDLGGGNVLHGDGLRLAEEISLEVMIAKVHGVLKLLAVFHFLRQQFNPAALHIEGDRCLARRIGRQKIHLDHVREGQQTEAVRIWNVIIQGDDIAGAAQTVAGRNRLLIGDHILQYFNYHAVARQQGDHLAQQDVAGAIDIRGAIAGERCRTDQQREVDGAAGGFVRVCRAEEGLRAGAEEQFVTVRILLTIQNWLARNIPCVGPGLGADERRRWNRSNGIGYGSGAHVSDVP